MPVLLRGNQDPAPRLYCCCSTVPPLSLHPLPSLISICLNLPLGTQGGPLRLSEAHFFKKWAAQKGFCAQEPLRAKRGHNTIINIIPIVAKKKKKGFSKGKDTGYQEQKGNLTR